MRAARKSDDMERSRVDHFNPYDIFQCDSRVAPAKIRVRESHMEGRVHAAMRPGERELCSRRCLKR